MNTQIINFNNQNSININETGTGGFLSLNEDIDGYKIICKMHTDSGEAEIYVCEKDNEQYILKYYYNCSPKLDILEKIKNFKHPDIISLYEYGTYKEHFFEILEYAKGGSLDSKLSDGKYKYLPVTEETAIQIVKETINAFDACHKVGIIHRDIKPGNLFYKNEDGTDILVGDFGISSEFDIQDGMSKHLTQTSARTEGYSAPEVYSSVIGPELDYYSLGVTLWELLTAEEPFINENGNAMFPNEIMLNTLQGKMCEILISRAPKLSPRMKQLIRGLMVTRHDKRWNHDLVTRFINGEDIPVFQETTAIPSITIGDKKCTSLKEISQVIISGTQTAKEFVYKGLLCRYLARVDQKLASKISDMIDDYSAKNELDSGLFHIAYNLCPNLEFKITDNTFIRSVSDIEHMLETQPDAMLPFLTDESKNFYTYLSIMGMQNSCTKIKEIVSKSSNNFIIVPKILVALKGNDISPFKDGKNDNLHLKDLKQLGNLPANLKERILLFIDAGNRQVCAWIENLSGKDLSVWRKSLEKDSFRNNCKIWGKWYYFELFLKGIYIPYYEKFEDGIEDNLRYGLKDINGEIAFPAIWQDIKCESVQNQFVVKKNNKWGVVGVDGKQILPLIYNDVEIWNPEKNQYQVKDYNGNYKIINTSNFELYSSRNKIYKASCKNKPFAVVYSSSGLFNYNQTSLSLKQSFDGVFCYSADDHVMVWGKTGTYSLYDETGRIILNTQFTFIYNVFSKDYLLAEKEGSYVIVSLKEKKVISKSYENVLYSKDAVILFENGKYEIYVLDQNHRITCNYYLQKDNVMSGSFFNNGNHPILDFKYIYEFEKDFDNTRKTFDGILNGFNNEGFYSFDCKNGLKIKREKILPDEERYITTLTPLKDLYENLFLLNEQQNYVSINRIVSLIWESYYNKGDYNNAKQLLQYLRYDHREELNKNFDYYLGILGKIEYKQGNYQDSFDYFQMAANLNSSDFEYFWREGDAAMGIFKYQMALSLYESAINLQPTNADLYNRKANALFKLKNFKEAIAMYSMAIDKYECSIFYKNRADAYDKLSENGAPELKQKAAADRAKAEQLK